MLLENMTLKSTKYKDGGSFLESTETVCKRSDAVQKLSTAPSVHLKARDRRRVSCKLYNYRRNCLAPTHHLQYTTVLGEAFLNKP